MKHLKELSEELIVSTMLAKELDLSDENRKLKVLKEINYCQNQMKISASKRLHKIIDKNIERSQIAEKSSCKKGCSHCCHQHVAITEGEALLLLDTCKQKGIEIDKDRLKKQASWPSDFGIWREDRDWETMRTPFFT